MNKQIRVVWFVVLVLIISLMVSTTTIQFLNAKELLESPYNSARNLYQMSSASRGAILVHERGADGRKVAYSENSNDSFGLQRVFLDSKIYSPITGFFSISHWVDRGVEAAMNYELTGEISQLATQKFTNFFMNKPNLAADVLLTVDSNLQKVSYETLESLGGKKGAVVAVEPKSGRILALASYPSYDANELAAHDTKVAGDAYQKAAEDAAHPMLNRAVSEIYPPGSTFKLITAAAALESGEYEPETIVDSPRTYRLPGTDVELPNSDGASCRSDGKESLKRALEVSCNTAFAIIGNKLGSSTMSKYAKAFGIGDKFSIAADNFTAAVSKFPDNASQDRLALASIGQGDVSLTPLQDCIISATVANRGVLLRPRIVDDVRYGSNVLKTYSSTVYRQPIRTETAEKLAQMMYGNVANGVASGARIPGVKVAGKTGTAENDPKLPPHAWFTGFAPLEDPKIAVSVFIENGESGGTNAAVLAAKVMKAYLEETN
ncbi:MAG: penicillin-binding protein 2 [Candidatus Ancillula trichonymphae]|jgi:peptidoglycan glycosyltransferase|nr:penicillin-binding protein 2 [Candidatus Ancillula trichonymphae]